MNTHIEDLSVLEPLEHSVLEVARNGRPMAGILVLEPLEHSVPEVTLVWGDCSLIRMTVSDPLEHSGLGVNIHVDIDSLWMAPWDAGGTLRSGYRSGMAIWRDVLCCVVRLSRMPVLPATGYLRSFGGLGRTCIIDLNAGESTVPIEMLGEDTQMDFPRPQFLSGGVEVLPSTSVTLMSDNSRRRGCAGNGHSPPSPGENSITDLGFPRASCTLGEMCAAELDFPRVSFPPGESGTM